MYSFHHNFWTNWARKSPSLRFHRSICSKVIIEWTWYMCAFFFVVIVTHFSPIKTIRLFSYSESRQGISTHLSTLAGDVLMPAWAFVPIPKFRSLWDSNDLGDILWDSEERYLDEKWTSEFWFKFSSELKIRIRSLTLCREKDPDGKGIYIGV